MGKLGDESRSIRTQLARIVLIPSVTFVVLFCVLSAATLVQAVSLKLSALDGQSAIHIYQAHIHLQAERRIAVEYLNAPDAATLQEFQDQREATDAAVAEAVPRVRSLTGRGDTAVHQSATELLEAWQTRDDVRAAVLRQQSDATETAERYGRILDTGLAVIDAAGRTVDDGASVAEGTRAGDLMRAQEHLARADTLLSGAIAAGTLTPREQVTFTGLTDRARTDLTVSATGMADPPAEHHDTLVTGPAWNQLADAIATVSGRDLAVADTEPVSPAEPDIPAEPAEDRPDDTPPLARTQWRDAIDPVNTALAELVHAQWDVLVTTADAAGNRMLTGSIGGGLIAMFAGALAFGVASRSSHRLIRRLLRLRVETLSQAQQELPRIVERLERGEPVDLATELRQLDHGTDEIGQVASAFNTAQRTAVAAAVRQAEIRDGASRVFMAIAHRNQSLVQRQLALLDRVEREEDDPEVLDALFQLDHLATRGRRHAENLIILGGAQPGRRWRTPVPLMDILRGAVSETEEYARVQIRQVPDVALRGSAVADLIHLVAELVENATTFSPPHTSVQIHAENVPKGVVVEVEDRGLGMTDDNLDAANRTLSRTPEFDVMALTEDSRLGLFVVARLAHKHAINVQLRPSPYGGIRAIVLVPRALIVGATPRAAANGRAEHRPGTPPPKRQKPDLAHQPGQHTHPATPGSGNGRPEHATVPGDGTTARRDEVRTRDATAVNGTPAAQPAAPNPDRPVNGRPSLPARRPPGTTGAEPPTGERRRDRPPLPKRVRQASIVPQLRDDPGTSDTGPTQRAPEEIRRTMSALQNGTRRGRETGPRDGRDPGGADDQRR